MTDPITFLFGCAFILIGLGGFTGLLEWFDRRSGGRLSATVSGWLGGER